MSVERDFKKDLVLDQYDLIQCALEQPELFAHWGNEWADAVSRRDGLKDKLALVRSECDQEIRETPSEFGWTKLEKSPTEAFIASAVNTHSNFAIANEEFQEAQHDVNVMMVAKEAFEHRSKMIHIISQLYLSGYYSGNKKLDKGYQEVLPAAAEQAQNESLEKSPRLARRIRTEV